jgi:hypothetical protein
MKKFSTINIWNLNLATNLGPKNRLTDMESKEIIFYCTGRDLMGKLGWKGSNFTTSCL